MNIFNLRGFVPFWFDDGEDKISSLIPRCVSSFSDASSRIDIVGNENS